VIGVATAVAVAVAIAAPSMLNGYVLYLATLAAVYSVAGLGMTMLLGWTGQISLLQAAFVGLGAYGTDLVFQHWHLPWAISMLLVAFSLGVAGTALALPAIRLRGFYLAIATLALAEAIVYGFVSFTSITGGSNGAYVPEVVLLGLSQTSSIWYLSIITLVVALVGLGRIQRGSFGRMLLGVRDAEVAMGPMQVSPVAYKLAAFAIASLLASIAGALYAQLVTYITPQSFDLPLLIELLVVVFLGGIDSVAGPPIGAAFVIGLNELLQKAGTIQPVIFGAVLIIVILFLPRGLASIPERVREHRWADRGVGGVIRRLLTLPPRAAEGQQSRDLYPAEPSQGGRRHGQ